MGFVCLFIWSFCGCDGFHSLKVSRVVLACGVWYYWRGMHSQVLPGNWFCVASLFLYLSRRGIIRVDQVVEKHGYKLKFSSDFGECKIGYIDGYYRIKEHQFFLLQRLCLYWSRLCFGLIWIALKNIWQNWAGLTQQRRGSTLWGVWSKLKLFFCSKYLR